MDRLPRGIIDIVYRYISMYNYKRVRAQYKRVWLCGYRHNTDKIYWNSTVSYFTNSRHSCVANFRAKRSLYAKAARDIRNFYNRKVMGQVPINYF